MKPNSDFLNAADCPLFTKGECHLQEEVDSKSKKIKELEGNVEILTTENSNLKETISEQEMQIIELEEAGLKYSVNLGLDTIHFRLEHGNLLIQQQVEEFFNKLKSPSTCSPIF